MEHKITLKDHIIEKFGKEAFIRDYYRDAALYKIADQILLRRKELGLTQKELAKKAGTTQTVISRIENVSVKPSLESLIKIADALDSAIRMDLVPLNEIKPFETAHDEMRKRSQSAREGIHYFHEIVIQEAPGLQTVWTAENFLVSGFSVFHSPGEIKKKKKVFA